MIYSTTWYHLDKNNNIIASHIGKACFSNICNFGFPKEVKYLLYTFKDQMNVSTKAAQKYFNFIKSIPEFKELMPKNSLKLAREGEFKIDLTKYNGTKVFTILTLIRVVVEDPTIVHAINKFNRKFKYSLSNFSILKLCGSILTTNHNHWITMQIEKKNLKTMFNKRDYWDSIIPCIETGLGRHIYDTFSCNGDGFYSKGYTRDYINEIKGEKNAVV